MWSPNVVMIDFSFLKHVLAWQEHPLRHLGLCLSVQNTDYLQVVQAHDLYFLCEVDWVGVFPTVDGFLRYLSAAF